MGRTVGSRCGSVRSPACRSYFCRDTTRAIVHSPSDINYRANIDALKRAGVTDLISLSACGSFKEELPPGHVRADRPVRRPYP